MVRDGMRRRVWSPWFIGAALLAGVVNGLLGAGGGIVMLYLVRYAMRGDDLLTGKDAFASVVAIIIPVSVISAITYGAGGNIDMDMMRTLIIPALLGGISGAYLTDKLPTRIIRGVFAVLVIISGVRMIW